MRMIATTIRDTPGIFDETVFLRCEAISPKRTAELDLQAFLC